jgi:hypothetical protein
MTLPTIVLLYDDSAYVETYRRPRAAGSDEPMGLVGRQVGGREFLDAYLTNGHLNQPLGVLWCEANADSHQNFLAPKQISCETSSIPNC